jgi:hypothetical protein
MATRRRRTAGFCYHFDDSGHKNKTVVYAPQATLRAHWNDQEDVDEIGTVAICAYQRRDSRSTTPLRGHAAKGRVALLRVRYRAQTRLRAKKRYFQGRVLGWMIMNSRIVKTYGKTVRHRPEEERQREFIPQLSPHGAAQVDGKYWFPIYTKAGRHAFTSDE